MLALGAMLADQYSSLLLQSCHLARLALMRDQPSGAALTVFDRADGYPGVMLEDLVTRGIELIQRERKARTRIESVTERMSSSVRCPLYSFRTNMSNGLGEVMSWEPKRPEAQSNTPTRLTFVFHVRRIALWNLDEDYARFGLDEVRLACRSYCARPRAGSCVWSHLEVGSMRTARDARHDRSL